MTMIFVTPKKWTIRKKNKFYAPCMKKLKWKSYYYMIIIDYLVISVDQLTGCYKPEVL